MKTDQKKRQRRLKNTPESVKAVALKYTSRVAFARGDPAKYKAARRFGDAVFDDICSHMREIPMGQPVKWTWYSTLREARKYKNISEFRRNADAAYQKMLRRGWRKRFEQHLPASWFERGERKKHQKLRLIDAIKIALKYESKTDFRREDYACYQYAQAHGWLDIICEHMQKNTKWSHSLLLVEAAKYKTYAEFAANSRSAHQTARNLEMIDEIKAIYDD